tara:strand:- start:102 stop:227 length:126 start_codon:yes stop_codon:yes gene_type:complete
MNNIEQLIPIFIVGALGWFVLAGFRELLKETSIAFNKKSTA